MITDEATKRGIKISSNAIAELTKNILPEPVPVQFSAYILTAAFCLKLLREMYKIPKVKKTEKQIIEAILELSREL